MALNKKKMVAYILVCITVFVLIFTLNHFTLYTADDFVYKFIYRTPFPDGHELPISNLLDLIKSQINHWKIWNGRFTGHSIVQIFMQFDKIWFDLFNSLAFLSLGLLLNKISVRLTDDKTKESSA